ncbi:MAG TPA: glycosyltransferase family 2 protein [Bacteroidia bacterium]|nr:glycosyltransferase family 2 protein [Bacteroidia bacterium]
MTKITVIIVNYNVAYFLEQCLHSVKKALQHVTGEVIVVDNNSVDGSVAMVLQKFPEFSVIANKQNTGFSFANNQALKIAHGEYCLLLNPDTVVEEDTFKKVVEFMDMHPDAGGLGVKMIDGKGNFLPESKRGLPTPSVAFYKIFGLSMLFPKSKIFGRYHLGYLDKEKTHEVEILSGAFMLMRKSVLDQVGLLDEAFFMYGEDIDLSYRIIKGGYKNYYFPGTSIIHYKGESTKKSSVNYVFVFYKAMVIFARKHFSDKNANLFSLLINIAIYLRASAAIATRFIKKLLLPGIEALFIFAALQYLVNYWEKNVKYIHGGNYPEELLGIIIPIYIVIWLFNVWISGGYDKPIKLNKIIKGFSIGTALILVAYALIPEDLRFSRAIILLGAAAAAVISISIRVILSVLKINGYSLGTAQHKRFLIVGNYDESKRVAELLEKTSIIPSSILFLCVDDDLDKPTDYFTGNLSQLEESIMIHKIDEIIFCAKDLSSQKIIELMSRLVQTNVDFKIAPPESLFLVGSNSIDSAGDLYVIDINSIAKPENKRNKRLFDIFTSIIMLMLFPILFMFVQHKIGFLKNIFSVLFGMKSWVGYNSIQKQEEPLLKPLPVIKKGVLSPADGIKVQPNNNNINKLNLLYSKDYTVWQDLKIVLSAFKQLGAG